MNTLKVTKWFGYSLLCLAILSIPLALAGLWVTRGALDRFSHENSVREDGEQIDLLLPGKQFAQTASDRGAAASGDLPSEAALPQTSSSQIEEQAADRISEAKFDWTPEAPSFTGMDLYLHSDGVYQMGGIAAVDPNNGRINPLGGIAAVDPNNGRINPLGGIAAVDPNNGRINPMGGIPAVDQMLDPFRFCPTGGIPAVDPNNGRINPLGGIAAVDPNNGRLYPLVGISAVDQTLNPYWLCPTGWIAAVDPNK